MTDGRQGPSRRTRAKSISLRNSSMPGSLASSPSFARIVQPSSPTQHAAKSASHALSVPLPSHAHTQAPWSRKLAITANAAAYTLECAISGACGVCGRARSLHGAAPVQAATSHNSRSPRTRTEAVDLHRQRRANPSTTSSQSASPASPPPATMIQRPDVCDAACASSFSCVYVLICICTHTHTHTYTHTCVYAFMDVYIDTIHIYMNIRRTWRQGCCILLPAHCAVIGT